MRLLSTARAYATRCSEAAPPVPALAAWATAERLVLHAGSAHSASSSWSTWCRMLLIHSMSCSAFSMAALLHQILDPSGLLSAQVGMRLTDKRIMTESKSSALREGLSAWPSSIVVFHHEGVSCHTFERELQAICTENRWISPTKDLHLWPYSLHSEELRTWTCQTRPCQRRGRWQSQLLHRHASALGVGAAVQHQYLECQRQ